MLRFSVNLDPENNVTRVKSFPESPDPILVGRDKECQLRLRHNSVSRRHCQIELTGDGYLVEDLGSTQGTTLNGSPLPVGVSTPIHHGDKLSFGAIEATVAILEDPEAADQLEDAAHDAVANLLGRFVQGPSSDTTAYLKILNGDDEGVKFLLVSGCCWTVGRQEECDFVIHNPTISREQAKIIQENGAYFIEDLDSQHGTEINGQKISDRQRLVHLDRVKMGPIKAIFFDPSQELLSALEYVEQSNEASAARALEVDATGAKTVGIKKPPVEMPPISTSPASKTAPSVKDDTDVAAEFPDDDIASALNSSTLPDVSSLQDDNKVTPEIDPNQTAPDAGALVAPVKMAAAGTVSSGGPRRPRRPAGSKSTTVTARADNEVSASQSFSGTSPSAVSTTKPAAEPEPAIIVHTKSRQVARRSSIANQAAIATCVTNSPSTVVRQKYGNIMIPLTIIAVCFVILVFCAIYMVFGN